MRPTGRKKSLLVGINYFGQRGELRGCINDVKNMKAVLQSYGFPTDPSSMVVLTDDNRDRQSQVLRGPMGGLPAGQTYPQCGGAVDYRGPPCPPPQSSNNAHRGLKARSRPEPQSVGVPGQREPFLFLWRGLTARCWTARTMCVGASLR